MAASNPRDLFVRHPDVVGNVEHKGHAAQIIPGGIASADARVATIQLPSGAPKFTPESDYYWTPVSIIQYVDSQIDSKDDPGEPGYVRGIGEWKGFLTWPQDEWNRATQSLSFPGEVDPFGSTGQDGEEPAFLGIRLPVSKHPLTWADVLHIRDMLVPRPPDTPPTLRYRDRKRMAASPSGGGRRRKSRKAKKSAHKSRKHRKSKRNTRRRRRVKHRRTRR